MTSGAEGVQYEAMRHEVFRVGPQRLQRGPDGRLPALEFKNIGKPDASMRTDAAERQITHIHPTSNQRSRDAQDAPLVLREVTSRVEQRNLLSRGFLKQVRNDPGGRGGNLDGLPCTIRMHQQHLDTIRWRATFQEVSTTHHGRAVTGGAGCSVPSIPYPSRPPVTGISGMMPSPVKCQD